MVKEAHGTLRLGGLRNNRGVNRRVRDGLDKICMKKNGVFEGAILY